MIRRISRWLFARTCHHRFRYEELALTGIEQPPNPGAGASWSECLRWADQVIGGNHPSQTHRVRWTCCKCGKVFFAHCGLDILAKHGRMVPQPDDSHATGGAHVCGGRNKPACHQPTTPAASVRGGRHGETL